MAAALALATGGCASVSHQQTNYPEARAYNARADAAAEVDAALVRAAQRNTRVLLVMGANWCHDSRALAGWLATPRLSALVQERYEIVFVDVGTPQTGEGRNLDLAERFGLRGISGTPNILILTPAGVLVNSESATSWRNAASRSETAILDELTELATRPV